MGSTSTNSSALLSRHMEGLKTYRPGRLARNTMILTMDWGLRAVLQATLFLGFARSLGAEGYGQFVATLAITALFAPFVGLGSAAWLQRQTARNPEAFPPEFGRAFLLILLSSPILFVLHPPTKVALQENGFYDQLMAKPNVFFRPRYKYHDFVKILDRSEFVVTDGGSNQEECYYLGHPCLLLRHVTERTEGLGENVVISGFDSHIVNDFIDNYPKLKQDRFDADSSPSRLIISTLQHHMLNSKNLINNT